jgi:hypothetical protein
MGEVGLDHHSVGALRAVDGFDSLCYELPGIPGSS